MKEMDDKKRLEEIERQLIHGSLAWLVKYAKEQAERAQELEELAESYKIELMIKDNAKKRAKQRSKYYREALERIKLSVKTHGNEKHFPKVVEEIVNEALEGTL